MMYLRFNNDQPAAEKYIAVEYDQETQRRLRNWCKSHGFDLTYDFDNSRQPTFDFDFHTTIIFSNSTHKLMNNSFHITPNNSLLDTTVTATGFEILGKDRRIPVMRVEGAGLTNLRKMVERRGMTDDFPEWKAHISLSYAPEIPDISKLSIPTFPLVFDQLHIKDAVRV